MQEPLCVKKFQKLSLLFLHKILFTRFRPAIVVRAWQSRGSIGGSKPFDRLLEIPIYCSSDNSVSAFAAADSRDLSRHLQLLTRVLIQCASAALCVRRCVRPPQCMCPPPCASCRVRTPPIASDTVYVSAGARGHRCGGVRAGAGRW